MKLTAKLGKAFTFAQKAHGKQVRKGTAIPYVSHPMAVASIVLEHGGSEDQAVAALLHDTVEDCGVSYAQLTRAFGPAATRIVKDCTDADTLPKPPWKERKVRYLEHLRRASGPRSLIVSAADKLHNAQAIVRDVKRHGKGVWGRFSAPPSEIAWYYLTLVAIYKARAAELPSEFRLLVRELEAVVKELKALAV